MWVPIDHLVKAVNLIPNEQQRGSAQPASADARASRAGGGAFGAYAILGALAFAIAASAMYVTTGNKVSERKAKLAAVSEQAEVARQQAASYQAFADFKTLSDSRVATVSSLAHSRFDWAVTLDDFSRALPTDVFISSMKASTTAANGGGSARGAIQAPAIEVAGCTKNQSSVARLMSRLRNIRGVTRVSLESSTVQDASLSTAAAPVTPTGDDVKNSPKTFSLPCPDGSPPAFTLVTFFERAALESGAVPNIGTATGVAGPTGAAGAPTGPTGSTGSTTTPASSTTTTTP